MKTTNGKAATTSRTVELCGGRGKEYKMSYNPFVSPEWRTAILTLDNGERVRAKVLMPHTHKPLWHTDFERRFIHEFNKSQPKAIHKDVKVHILRS